MKKDFIGKDYGNEVGIAIGTWLDCEVCMCLKGKAEEFLFEREE